MNDNPDIMRADAAWQIKPEHKAIAEKIVLLVWPMENPDDSENKQWIEQKTKIFAAIIARETWARGGLQLEETFFGIQEEDDSASSRYILPVCQYEVPCDGDSAGVCGCGESSIAKWIWLGKDHHLSEMFVCAEHDKIIATAEAKAALTPPEKGDKG